jgi:hypothetical protein
MNTANYNRLSIVSKNKTFLAQCHREFVGCRKITNNAYLVDKLKFWYLKFVYDFLYKCFDMTKIHFIEGDTDRMYIAVAGNPNDDYNQGFKYVIKNTEYYDKFVYKWLTDPN